MANTAPTHTIIIPNSDRSEAGVSDSWAKQTTVLDVINVRGLTDADYTRTSEDGAVHFEFTSQEDFSAARRALKDVNRVAEAEAGIPRYGDLALELH